MKAVRRTLPLAAVSLLCACAGEPGPVPDEAPTPSVSESEPEDAPIAPQYVDDFALIDQNGEYHALYESDAKAVVLVTYSVGCPILRWNIPHIEELAERFGDRGVEFYYLDGTVHDTRADVLEDTREFKISVPVLLDASQNVVRSLGARRTADAFLVDTRDWRVRYRGKVNDRATYGSQSGGSKRDHLAEALESLLDGEPIEIERTRAEGCLILFEDRDEDPPDYSADVAPVLLRRCVGCHSDAGVAPWSMSSHGKLRGWAPMIREVVLTKRMPPWHADPHVGSFTNDRSLTPAEARTLVRWIDAGTPRGSGPDPLEDDVAEVKRLLDLQPEGEPPWPLGEPDIVLRGPHHEIQATGIVPYLYEWIEYEVEEDYWVRGVHLRPSNHKVLHHSLILVFYPEHLKHLEPDYQDGVGSYFALYVPHMKPRMFPEAAGKLLPKGSKIMLQTHYQTTGRPETDRTSLALYLHDEPPAVEFASTAAIQWELDIPPRDPHYEVTASTTFEDDVRLYDLIPHMHYRGRQFDFEARYPDGTREVLLSVPRYDFNWQTSYQLETPAALPAGTEIVCRAVFDNSERNIYNPNPDKRVAWGPQSWAEMMTGYMNYAVDREQDSGAPAGP